MFYTNKNLQKSTIFRNYDKYLLNNDEKKGQYRRNSEAILWIYQHLKTTIS